MSEQTPDPMIFVDKQININNDIVKTLTGISKGLTTQDRVNNTIIDKLHEQATALNTHRQLITALAFLNLATGITAIIALLG